MASTQNGQQSNNDNERSALILYGTETGNSEECAGELGRMLERLHFTTSVTEMDSVEINVLLQYTIVVFAISTTGQGEFPQNARKFWKSLLRKRLPPGCLQRMNFTTFGLGDSSYSKFNWTARKLHKRLEQLGGNELYPRGEADDQHEDGWDGTFLSWKIDLSKHILEKHPLSEGQEVIPIEQPLSPKFLLEELPAIHASPGAAITSDSVNCTDNNQKPGENSSSHLISSSSDNKCASEASHHSKMLYKNEDIPGAAIPAWIAEGPPTCQQLREPHPDAKVQVDKDLPSGTLLNINRGKVAWLLYNKRVTPQKHWQDVRQLTFLVDDYISWLPGDVMTIYPKNFPEDVQTLIDLQGWNDHADIPLQLTSTSKDDSKSNRTLISGIPESLRLVRGSTLRDLLTNNLDITAIPKRNFLQNMSYFTTDEMHRDRLLEFCQPMYTDEFFDYATRPRRSILEVLSEFSSVKFPWNQAAWLFPPIRGRQFSISNAHPTSRYDDGHEQVQVELLVAMVKYKTVLKKIRQGLCSRYLASLLEGSEIKVSFDRPSDKFYDVASREPGRPVIMVAAGTGVAPCRALIEERAHHAAENPHNFFAKTLLIYGGRNKDADFFFNKDWGRRGANVVVKTAFSRDQKEKFYVQDVIRRDSADIHRLIWEGAIVYVCGSAGAMPKSVRQAFLDVLVEFVDVGTGVERDMEAVQVKAEKILEDMSKRGRYIEEVW